MNNFFIKKNYKPRLENNSFDDTKLTDQWQKEVYEFAKQVADRHKFQNILDIGTGSGYKLIKHFNNCNTLGIDIPSTVEFLKNKYPNKAWSDNFNPVKGYDLVISSDVIEHLPDPDVLLNLIISSAPKLIVISTPDRNLLYQGDHNGPPYNKAHVREWTMPEFYNYISSRLQVLEHFISNHAQSTQVILATLKENHHALV
jgi:ubiquinone/menaquinone biosynthesis C-methylase UbiE